MFLDVLSLLRLLLLSLLLLLLLLRDHIVMSKHTIISRVDESLFNVPTQRLVGHTRRCSLTAHQ